MKTTEKDILQNKLLRQTTYNVPEGYFSALEQRLKAIPEQKSERLTLRKRFAPYAAIAAMFAMIMAAGGFFVGKSWTEGNITEQYADVITEDDIIEYLIYTDVEIEELEQY
jgi:hypothetical protein